MKEGDRDEKEMNERGKVCKGKGMKREQKGRGEWR